MRIYIDIKSAYKILEIEPGVSQEEIKQAYRKLVKIWHPDRFLEVSKKREAEEQIKIINEAYEYLKNYQPSSDNFDSNSLKTGTKVSSNSSSAENFYERGMEKAQRGKYGEAIEDFTQAIRLNSNYFEAYKFRALACQKLGYENRAISDFKKAAELEFKSKYTPKEPEISKTTKAEQEKVSPWKVFKSLSHGNYVLTVAISPDSEILASGSNEATIKLWDLRTGKLLHTLTGHTKSVRSVVFSPDGKTLASGGDDANIIIWQVSTGKLLKIIKVNASPIFALVFSHDAQKLISGSSDSGIKIIHVEMGEMLHLIKGHLGAIHALTKNNNGNDDRQILISASADKSIKIWEIKNRKLTHTLTGHSAWVKAVAMSCDNNTLASGSHDQTIKLWDINTGKLLQTLECHKRVFSIAFSPDSQLIASGNIDGSITLWQTSTGKKLYLLNSHSHYVNAVIFSPDSQSLVSASQDGKILIWKC